MNASQRLRAQRDWLKELNAAHKEVLQDLIGLYGRLELDETDHPAWHAAYELYEKIRS